MDAKKRQRVQHTDDWNQLELLLDWPEQVEYESIWEQDREGNLGG
jgi:hypothetical protein